MRKPGRGQILENRLVGPREVLGGGDRRVPAKGRGRTAPCRGRSGASWIWATPLTPARARGSSVRATPSLRPPRILKTSLFLQKGGPRKEPSQRTATALFYLIPCGDFQLSPREFYLSLIRRVRAVENTRITQDQDPQSYRHSAVGVHQLLNRGMRLQAIRSLQRHEIQGKFFLCQHNRRKGSVPTQGTKEVKTRPPDPKSPDGTEENLLKGPPDGTQPPERVGNSLGVCGRTRGLSQLRIFPDTLKQPPLRLRVPA